MEKPEKLKKYYVKTYEELYETINNRLKTISIPLPSKRKPFLVLKYTLRAKLNTAYNILLNEIDKNIELLNTIKNMHPFYGELFKLETGRDLDFYIKRFKRMKRITINIYREHYALIRNSSEKEDLVKAFRSGIGRLFSVYRRNQKIILELKKAAKELSKLPDITGGYIVIIAGMPQVGKSTLLSRLTRAKPKISPFPFTTKNVIVGHLNVEPYGKITLIDTPGILDRPLEEKNLVETKAVLAIKYLADALIYVFDVNPQSYYSFNEQLNVYNSIKEYLGDKEIIILINKIDITPSETLEERIEILKRNYGIDPIPVSAIRGDNLDLVREKLINMFMEKNQHLQ
ncbi:MAG: GTP-binding protein [Desulfurococcales archaeon ex4484_58]|nr:MAG: GTP-binding protein [Desulfurococcales archaeon ex4484_58]